MIDINLNGPSADLLRTILNRLPRDQVFDQGVRLTIDETNLQEEKPDWNIALYLTPSDETWDNYDWEQ